MDNYYRDICVGRSGKTERMDSLPVIDCRQVMAIHIPWLIVDKGGNIFLD
jgi:hypothetical protein